MADRPHDEMCWWVNRTEKETAWFLLHALPHRLQKRERSTAPTQECRDLSKSPSTPSGHGANVVFEDAPVQNDLFFVFAAMGTAVADPLSHCHDHLMQLAREEGRKERQERRGCRVLVTHT